MTRTDPWDKRRSTAEALELLDSPGLTIAFGGVTLYRRPMGLSLALLRKYHANGQPSEATLMCLTAGPESDILIQAGMAASIRTCYAGLEIFGLAPHFTAAISSGELEMIEETEGSFAYGLRASMAGVGFMPATAWQGTDLLTLRSDVKSIEDPYTGERLTAFPALKPDVALIHALEADREGNAAIGLNQGIDRELALVADRVILSCERIVSNLQHADIIGTIVDAVVEMPNGAWPTSCHPHYPLDGEALLEYTDKSLTDGYAQLIETWMEQHNLNELSS